LLSRRRAARANGVAADPVVPRLLTRLAADADAAAAAGGASSSSSPASTNTATTVPRLRVLCRTREQAEAAAVGGDEEDEDLDAHDEIILDFLEVHGLAEAVRSVQAAGCRAVVALPRVLKPGEHRLLYFYLGLGADALLLRGAGALQQLLELGGAGAPLPAEVVAKLPPGRPALIPPLEGDFSLNVANALAADLLLGGSIAAGDDDDAAAAADGRNVAPQMLSRLAPTHDLDAAQLARLAKALGPDRARRSLEAIVYSHLAIFHTEHCVFCRFLSSGNSYVDCGHPCERHALHLRDSEGRDNAVLADQGCRNTVFASQAQSAAFELQRLSRAGFGTLRIELVDEPAEVVKPLLAKHRAALRGELAPGELWRWLAQLPDRQGRVQGVTAGSLRVRREREAASLRPSARRV
jgi:U32 family peptidase